MTKGKKRAFKLMLVIAVAVALWILVLAASQCGRSVMGGVGIVFSLAGVIVFLIGLLTKGEDDDS